MTTVCAPTLAFENNTPSTSWLEWTGWRVLGVSEKLAQNSRRHAQRRRNDQRITSVQWRRKKKKEPGQMRSFSLTVLTKKLSFANMYSRRVQWLVSVKPPLNFCRHDKSKGFAISVQAFERILWAPWVLYHMWGNNVQRWANFLRPDSFSSPQPAAFRGCFAPPFSTPKVNYCDPADNRLASPDWRQRVCLPRVFQRISENYN